MAKSTTKYFKFRGKCAWARLFPGQEDEYNGKFKWKISLYPDEKTIAEIKATGCQLKWYEDDGAKSGVSGKYISVKRDTEKEFKNVIQKLTPPEVVDKDSKPFAEQPSIGNGSEVEVAVELYNTTRFGWGTRMLGVKVLDLIEYIPEESEGDQPGDEPKEGSKSKVRW